MQLGFVGVGKMGLNMVTRLIRRGHQVVAFDRNAEAVARAAAAGARGVASLDALVGALTGPRVVWIMVPAGEPTESTVASAIAFRPAISSSTEATRISVTIGLAPTDWRGAACITSTPAPAAASGGSSKATV